MYTYDYDFAYSPSLRVVEVALKPFGQDSEPLQVSAMIGSGSDGTLVPLPILRRLNARKTGQVALRSITGARSIVSIYEVTLRLRSHLFPKVRVAADTHNDKIILGRDLSNQIIVTLNGLASTTEIHE